MLGLGRALGETIAVVMIISPRFEIQPHVLEHGTSSVSSLIALRYGEASPFGISALMAADAGCGNACRRSGWSTAMDCSPS